MKKLLLIFLLILSCISSGICTTVKEVPNVHISDRNRYVSDPDGLLSPATVNRIDSRLRTLMDSTSAEMAVVVLNSTGDTPIEEFARQLTDEWKIGKSDTDNGLLLLVVMDQRAARIHTGYGMEGILPDITASEIIESEFIPRMREGDLDGALTATANTVADIVTDPVAAEEIRSARSNDELEALDTEAIQKAFMALASMVFIALIGLFIYDARRASRHITNYDKALEWRKHRYWYIAFAILSGGPGIIIAAIAWMCYRRYRTKRIRCATCGARMNRLGETEDNELLTSAEDTEEELKTVDYDVWLCPDCGTVEKFPFYATQNRYTPCPRCGAIAYGLVRDRVIQQPGPRSEGSGVRTYECRHCGYHDDKKYTIPRDESSLAAAAILGAAAAGMGRGGGGGGFSGGSFGGGSFGGGGATGHW